MTHECRENIRPCSGCITPDTGLSSARMDSIYAYVMERLQAAKGNWPKVAEESGVPLRTLEKIARREIQDPGVSHVEKLAAYFRTAASRPAAELRA